MREVKQERSGWRDLALSQRHRRWGWDCPAVDLDFLFLEYDNGVATALVEYKHENAAIQFPSHPTYMAMRDLGTRAKIPVFGVRYAADFSWWRVTGLNDCAKAWVPEQTTMTEHAWVSLLYLIRGRAVPDGLFVDCEVAV